jgi:PAS domain S-box-containing protein
LLAVGLVGAAVACRASLQHVAPQVGPYVLVFPAMVGAGLLWGTVPAALAAIVGGIATCVIGIVPHPFAPPMLSADNVGALLYVAASTATVWATDKLRRYAAKAEQAELRLAEVFRQFPGAASVLEGPSGRLLVNSDHSERILGHGAKFASGQVIAMAQYGGLHEDGRPYAADEYPIVRAYQRGEVTNAESLRYLRPDGRVVDLEVYAGPVRGADGRIVAAIGTALDVTDRVQAERRLRASELAYRATAERLRAAIDAGGLGVWEIDIATERMTLDATMAAMLGMPPNPVEISRAQMREMVHADDRQVVHDNMTTAIAAGGIYAEECRLLTAQGGVRWVVSHGTVLPDIQKVVGVIGDITERRERETALRDALAARDVLMHEADHRIKNSLQLVTSLLGLQMAKAPDLATRNALSEAIARVHAIAGAHRALETSPDLKSIGIDGLLAELCVRLGVLNPTITLSCHAATGLSLDAEQAIPLALIASEALTNALRHAFPAGEAGEVSLTLRLDATALDMIVADSGRGLPTANTRVGLGSSVIAALARQIGASVSTTSRPGEGVSVTVRLALAQMAGAQVEERLSAE